ncbi:DUF6882 domain-containing protein [Campylobacter concisus]|uniref:DUF6882 domain-containing protein n=1 Tax=Campylobacter concisus TaxID=199 RepID=UPI000D3017C4|nr:DUF6882 domain-containing protein [Campylobacter concisus]
MFLDKLGVDKSNWSELFSACVGKATLLQKRAFKLLVEGSNWQVDFDSGKIYFDEREFDMQFIGSESFSSNTWLWGYENINGFDEQLLELANKAREFGKKFGLSAFSTPRFDLDENFNGHTISMILCTAFDEQNYYRIEYEGGAAYVAFRSDVVFEEPVLANEILSVVNECLGAYELDHKIFIKGLLLSCDMKFSESPNEIVSDKYELSFKFDELNRLINISSKL